MKPKNEAEFFTALKEEYFLNSIEETIRSIKFITQAYTEVINSIYNTEPNLKEGEVLIETLSYKILLTTHSILELTKGFPLETSLKKGTVEQLDFSSVHILTRALIEAYLTLEYLYYNDLDPNEKLFRLRIWRISGYKSRQGFFKSEQGYSDKIAHQLEGEETEINDLLNLVKESVYYGKLTDQNLWKLDKYGLPRLMSWNVLLENSSLKTSVFSIPYKLYSNYAHSEFISLIQMNGEDTMAKGSEHNDLHLMNALRIVKMINCISLVKCTNYFNLEIFDKIDIELKRTIEFWSEYASKESR
tara:strand:+ start:13599 stop:14504 length:906 start_codon:yes stop_codon:yes gene_type:complete